MTELLTSAQMRAIEQAAMDSGQITGLELMERAGQGVVEAIVAEWPELETAPETRRAVVLCGPGNNGGDGFVVARLLRGRGWEVQVLFYGDAARLPPDARANYDRWGELGEITPLTQSALRASHPEYGNAYADIYVDALFGTGLSRALEGEAFDVMRHMSGVGGDDYWRRTVAVDVPSGLCADSGRVLAQEPTSEMKAASECAGRPAQGPQPLVDRSAALTVTFDSPKVGHFLGAGPSLCGRLVVKDIGLENWRCFQSRTPERPPFTMTERGPMGVLRPPAVSLTRKRSDVADRRDLLASSFVHLGKENTPSATHKFSHGHALILTGGAGRTGAARLSARAALRVGAGLVTLGAPGSAMMEVACQITALMLQRISDGDGLGEVLNDPRITELCVGPGLGLGAREAGLVDAALRAKRRVVLDADALTLIARSEALFGLLHQDCVLTPHAGEFARLFPDLAARLAEPATKGPAYSKVDAARDAARRAGCVVLFKGPDTVIADPKAGCAVNSAQYDQAAPWLATAGSGDVLAGLIAGLMARGVDPYAAAQTGAWLHVLAARRFGPGLIAEDLPEQIPGVLRDLKV